ncbi:MAG: hypothetical protein VB049_04905, partial [Candidatus Pelethousia sp.]|nr:hypothetical protein [Candidatus Pelethousia sp.]
ESQAAELAKISAEIYKTARCVSVLDAKTCEIGNSGCPRGLCGPPGISGDGEWNEQIAWLEMIRNVVNGLPQKIDWLTAQLAASQRREREAVYEVCRRCLDGEIIDGVRHYPCDGCKWRGPQEAGKGEAE